MARAYVGRLRISSSARDGCPELPLEFPPYEQRRHSPRCRWINSAGARRLECATRISKGTRRSKRTYSNAVGKSVRAFLYYARRTIVHARSTGSAQIDLQSTLLSIVTERECATTLIDCRYRNESNWCLSLWFGRDHRHLLRPMACR